MAIIERKVHIKQSLNTNFISIIPLYQGLYLIKKIVQYFSLIKGRFYNAKPQNFKAHYGKSVENFWETFYMQPITNLDILYFTQKL